MAYDIVNGLKKSIKAELLRELQQGVSKKKKQKGKKHFSFIIWCTEVL